MLSREYTKDEIRQQFLAHIHTLVDYWDRQVPDYTCRQKLDGLAFSILAMLDGTSELPAFIVAPSPHPDNKAFCQGEGENWYQENQDVQDNISGTLHILFGQSK